MAEQLSFDWPPRVALAEGDFFVSEANANAFALVSAPETWAGGRLLLIGPAGSGKTHLAQVFRAARDARVTEADRLDQGTVGVTHPGTAVIVEDADTLPEPGQEALFHLYNHLGATGGLLLITARSAPRDWNISLPDLRSRVEAMPQAIIQAPDDRLLSAVLMKRFQDHGIVPGPRLVPWLATRIERSFAAAHDIVDRLDRAALSERREVNEVLARALLDKDRDALR